MICKVDNCFNKTLAKSGYCLKHRKERKRIVEKLKKELPSAYFQDYTNFSFQALQEQCHNIKNTVNAFKARNGGKF